MRSITAGEIATNLNTSRNTVSKVLNSRGYVSEALKKRIVIEAVEKGYKNISGELMEYYRSLGDTSQRAEHTIVLIASGAELSACLMQVITGISNELSATQHRLIPYFMQPEEEEEFALPELFSQTEIDGVIVMGVSCPRMISLIAELPMAKVYLDLPYGTVSNDKYCKQSVRGDVIMLESSLVISRIVEYFVKKKRCATIGYVGSVSRFLSSNERYEAFRKGIEKYGVEFRAELCIADEDGTCLFNDEEIVTGLKNMKEMPEAFICENDRIAYALCRQLNILFPVEKKQIYVSGYNNIPPAGVTRGTLTTVEVNPIIVAKKSLDQLFWRMQHPEFPYETVYLATKIVLR